VYESLRADLHEAAERINAARPGSFVFVELPTVTVAQRLMLWRRYIYMYVFIYINI